MGVQTVKRLMKIYVIVILLGEAFLLFLSGCVSHNIMEKANWTENQRKFDQTALAVFNRVAGDEQEAKSEIHN